MIQTRLSLILALFLLVCKFPFGAPAVSIDFSHSNSLHAINIQYKGSQFYPSNFGGVGVIGSKGDLFQPWSENVKFKLLKTIYDTYAEWIMYKENDFYFHYEIDFEKDDNNLIIHMKDLGELNDNSLPNYYAPAYALYLDRCENAHKPVVVAVPYLTMFNILFANDCFVSMYFDWTKTNASQLVVYNNKSFTPASEYYSEYALYNPLTNGRRNTLDETIILKVSADFDAILPDLSNPISKYKEESSKRIIFDDWDDINNVFTNANKLNEAGIKNLWHIVHNDYTIVPSPIISFRSIILSDSKGIRICSNYDRGLGNLFSVHENYCELFSKSSEFDKNDLSLNSDGNFIFNWYDDASKDTSYLLKPSRILDYLSNVSRKIHTSYNTNSSFHDVSASYDPSKYVDYDYKADGAGKFSTPYNIFKTLADSLRKIHAGPVSSEGLAHFLYVGYYDDISTAQIHTARSLPGSYGTETEGGFYKPLLVNFDLLKMKEKAMVHGVGYFERFFYKDKYWQYMGRSRDSALMFSATELAYGHGAFISRSTYNFMEQGKIEYDYVYPMQLRYYNSEVESVHYNDNGEMIGISEYIRRHPYTFDKLDSKDFLGQVCIIYDNGVLIFVNRSPLKNWGLELQTGYGFYDFHAIYNNKDTLFVGYTNLSNLELPPSNGWVCFSPK